MNGPSLTFIIPTLGRATLSRAIGSLLAQTNPNWKAIVVFDGVKNTTNIKDNRVTYIEINKLGTRNHAGNVRNIGISRADTEWVAFLDDDDTVDLKYVDRFYEEINLNANVECVIFRMSNGHLVFPELNDKTFHINKVGISFAMKSSLPEKFSPSGTEDFYLLDKIRSNKRKIVISPYINYFVRIVPNDKFKNTDYPRILINF